MDDKMSPVTKFISTVLGVVLGLTCLGAILIGGFWLMGKVSAPTRRIEQATATARAEEQAQYFYEGAGGPWEDPFWLDDDKDGMACESLPYWQPGDVWGSDGLS